jgi:hypothetical protein
MPTKFKVVSFVAMLLLSLVFASASHALLNAVGPVDPATTFPAWYQDSTGLSLAPCFDANGFCTINMAAQPGFDPALPLVFPTNFPGEFFYFYATANPGAVLYIAALEGGLFPAGPTVPPQATFARIRIRDAAAPVGLYTVTHPYGVDANLEVTPQLVQQHRGLIFTEDIGVAAGVFTGALGGRIGPYLKKATGLVTSPDGNIYIGDSIATVAVTGTPVTSVTVVGPPAYGTFTTNLFVLQGKVLGMSVTPTTIAFPAQRPLVDSLPVPVTVANLDSLKILTLASIVPQGTNAADFKVVDVNCLTAPIGPAGTCTFNAVFNGAAAGPAARTASMLVSGVLATVPKATVTPITGIIDAVPPTVASHFPDTATAPANMTLTATFSEAMDPATIINPATAFTVLSSKPTLSTQVNGTVAYDAANKTATFTPNGDLDVGAVITAQTTASMTDVVGNALTPPLIFTFTTTTADRAAPLISSITPTNNATGVRTDAPITVIFSEQMLSTSITASVIQVTSGGVAVVGTVTTANDELNNKAIATFTPARPLEFGTAYTVTVSSGPVDLARNALALSQNQVLNFVTNFAPIAPEVLSPLNGATGVGRPVVLLWKPSVDQDLDTVQYHLFLCNNQNFIGTAPNCIQNVAVTPVAAAAKGIYYASVASGGMLFTLFGLSFAAGIKGRKKILLMIAVLVISGLFIVSCSSKSDSAAPPAQAPTELTFQVTGLAANVSYFWKMEADDGKGGVSTTPVMSFTTQ